MTNRPKVLVLTPRFPYPVVGGDRLRIYHICKELAQTCDLTLLSLCETKAEKNSQVPNDAVFKRIERVFLARWRSALNALTALPTRTPLQVAYYRSSLYKREVARLVAEHDICLAHLIRTGDYIRSLQTPRVLEMTDAISMNYQRVKNLSGKRGWRARIYGIEAERLLEYERRAIGEFDAVTLVSSVDRSFLLDERVNSSVMVCSNGVDLVQFPYIRPNTRERTIVFVGNMTTVQNLDACLYFIEEVLPILRKRGDFRFRIVGRIHPPEVSRLSKHDGVEIHSNVDSVPEAVGNAYAAVAPMRLGAGVQNKILEYLAMGLPTITSSVGLEGLATLPGRELLVADTPEIWVEQLLHLWNHIDQADAQSKAGRDYVERMHSWRSHLAPLVDTVHRLAAKEALG